MRYADQLGEQEQFCDAVSYYEAAQAIAPLDSLASEGYEEAFAACYPPTEVVTPTLSTPITLTPGGPTVTPTDTQPGPPPVTDTLAPPTETPTETPTPTPP